MYIIKGKYNSANIMVDSLDESTTSQLYNILNHPAFANTYVVIMPDAHAGIGSCVGFTMKMNDYVLPQIVGVDIGCGIDAYNLGKQEFSDERFRELQDFILKNIPSGHSIRSKMYESEHFDGRSIQDTGTSKSIYVICNQMGLKYQYMINSLGTLGGGNHFIELGRDPKGDVWLTIHSGSRKFGKDICDYHVNKAKEVMKKMFVGEAYAQMGLQYLPMDMGGRAYLEDMQVAQQYAIINRSIMAEIIIDGFFNIRWCQIPSLFSVKSVHNYINFKDGILRKGAISANVGEQVVIPLNQTDGTIIGVGKGNAKWNYSAPHGAGRLMSRKQAKASITIDEVKSDMEGIWTDSVNNSTIDESKRAYKDPRMIIDSISETVDIDFFLRPIFNFKAGE